LIMAGIGDDIREVLEELGTAATVYRLGGSVFSEKLDIETYPDSSTEFIRQFFATATTTFDSNIIAGDTVLVNGIYYLATNIQSSSFEDAVVDNTVALYRCNCNGTLRRLTIVRDENYVEVPTWTPLYTQVKTLQCEDRFGNEMILENDVMAFVAQKLSLYIPAGYPVKIDDRWQPNYLDHTEYYRITTIDKRRLSNVLICGLKEDSRV